MYVREVASALAQAGVECTTYTRAHGPGLPAEVASKLRTLAERLVLVAGTAVLLTAIGFSRLYLGVHYLSDVLAGVAGGAFWTAGHV